MLNLNPSILETHFFWYFCGFLDIKFCQGKKFEEETKRRRKVRDVFFGGPLVVRWSGGPSKETSFDGQNPANQLRLVVHPHYLQGFSTIPAGAGFYDIPVRGGGKVVL